MVNQGFMGEVTLKKRPKRRGPAQRWGRGADTETQVSRSLVIFEDFIITVWIDTIY
jgi:hypothetical protein